MGRWTKRKARITFLALLLAICFVLFPLSALALDNPDDLEILSVDVYRHLIEDNDFLLIAHTNIHYDADQPDESATQTFLMRLLSVSGNGTLGTCTPYAYYNDGYDEGCMSLYFPAASAPTWGQAHSLYLEGNPIYFDSPSTTVYTLQSDDYAGVSTQEEMQDELHDQVIDITDELETNWSMDGELYSYTSTGLVLSAVGQAYWIGAIPALQTMCPELFSLQIVSPTIDEEDFTQAQAEEYAGRWEGTMIGDFMDAIGDFFGGISGQLITTALCVLGVLAVVIFAIWRSQPAIGGFLAGWPIILMGTVAGFCSFTIMAVIGFASTALLGYFLLFRHGSG